MLMIPYYSNVRRALATWFCLNFLSIVSRFAYNSIGRFEDLRAGGFVSQKPKRAGERLISYRFAVTVIALLFGASAAGWIATELVPSDSPEKAQSSRAAWGATAAKLVALFRLYDPFHSFWYRFVLALFFVVLLLCVATRWRRLALKSWRIDLPSSAEELRNKTPSFEISWRLLTSGEEGLKDPLVRFGEMYGRKEPIRAETLRTFFSNISGILAKRGYRVASREHGGAIFFTADSGRWRSPGTMLFHIGILVITIGGVVGSFTGWRDMMFIREGGVAPLAPDSALSIRVDDFAIETTEQSEIKGFISTVSILDARGATIAFGNVEVNHPMKVDGRRIYQSEFTIDESEFKWARIEYAIRGRIKRGSVVVVPGKPVPIGDSTVTLTAARYLPDFRTSPEGPFSASSYASNPAL